jgi:hypothetical protein
MEGSQHMRGARRVLLVAALAGLAMSLGLVGCKTKSDDVTAGNVAPEMKAKMQGIQAQAEQKAGMKTPGK